MPVKKNVKKKISKKSASVSSVGSSQRKLGLVAKNLITFAVLSILSYIFYKVSGTEFYQELFFLFFILLGIVALAFFIVWLVLLAMKGMKK